MSKNMTRKGLAFGAGLSLVVAGLGTPPANAIELNEGIVLAPTSGPSSAYAIFADDGASFSISASPVTSVMAGSGTVKFKVTDPTASFSPGANSTVGYTQAATTGVVAADTAGRLESINATSDSIILSVASTIPNGTYIVYANDGDLKVDDASDADLQTILSKDTLTTAVVYDEKVLLFAEGAADIDASIDEIDATRSLTFVPGGNIAASTDVYTIAASAATLKSGAGNVVITQAAGLPAGQYVVSSDVDVKVSDAGVGSTTVVAAGVKFIVTSAGATGDLTFSSPVNVEAGAATEVDILDNEIKLTVHTTSAPRAADNSFVVDSQVTTAGSTASLELIANGATTQSATVQAWVDDFSNNLINAGSEYTSVAQTIQFLENDDVTLVTNLVTPSPGDSKLTAKITTTPMINGAEDDKTDPIAAIITRQDSVAKALVVATQSDLTGTWTAEINTDISATTVKHWVNSTTALDTESWMKSYTGTTGVRMDDAVEALGRVDRTRVVIEDDIATVTTQDGAVTDAAREAHFLQVGDKVTFAGTATGVLTSEEFTVLSVPSEFTFTFAVPADTTDVSYVADDTKQSYTVTTWDASVAKRDRVYAGDHSAVGALEVDTNKYEVSGAASASGTLAAVSADVIFSSVASATVQGKSLKTDDGSEKILVKKGTTSAEIKVTAVDKLGVAVGAGRSVAITLSSRTSTVKVNGLTTEGETLQTDANGQVTLTVSSSTAADGDAVTIKAVAEGVTTADSQIVVEWDAQAYSLYDLSTTQAALASYTRTVLAGSSYSMDLMLADQWYQAAPAATYRLQVTGTGSNAGNISLVDGKATVTASDLLGANFSTAIAIQKATAGVFATTSTVTVSNVVVAADSAKVTLAADASSLYDSVTADLSDKVAAKALVERDVRKAFAVQPAYTNDVVVSGKVTKASSGASQSGAVVTISGSSSILFSDGDVDSRGSITVVADTSGEFSVKLYSTTALTASVITVAALGESATTKVSFTGIGVGEGTALTVTAPAAVKPASTFQVKAKLADVYGNGVDTAAGRVKVTYTGPGIIFGTLPTETDANGELQFSVLLGANDTGSVSVTVSYDQNGDADYVDAKDLTTSATVAINATGTAAGDAKVNAGSFKGYVALYAKGYAGQRMSAKVGNDWVVVPVLASNFERVVEFTGAGYTVAVRIYIDRVLIDTITVTTK